MNERNEEERIEQKRERELTLETKTFLLSYAKFGEHLLSIGKQR